MNYLAPSQSCQIPHLNAFYEKYFGYLAHGIFVEVGANDGYSWSNTWHLAEMGWKGLYYEAMPALAEACRKRHAANKVKVVQACVGEFYGKTKLFLGAGATTSFKVAQENTFSYGNSPERFVISQVVSLNQSLVEQHIPHNFHLLVIDVDGDEVGVLRGLDLFAWKPRMIIVETNKAHPIVSWRFNAEVIDSLLLPWYNEVYFDHINSIYVRKDAKHGQPV